MAAVPHIEAHSPQMEPPLTRNPLTQVAPHGRRPHADLATPSPLLASSTDEPEPRLICALAEFAAAGFGTRHSQPRLAVMSFFERERCPKVPSGHRDLTTDVRPYDPDKPQPTIDDLATSCGCSRGLIHRIVRDAGKRRRPRGRVGTRDAEVPR